MTHRQTFALPLVFSLVCLAPGGAQAFCGTYVGSPGSETTNAGSRIAIARDGDQLVLTMANDYSGDLDDFGMLIPVPATVTLDDVRVVSPEALNALDVYTGPRLVTYTEEEAAAGVNPGNTRWVDGEETSESHSSGCGSPPPSAPPENTMTTATTGSPGKTLGSESFDEVVLEEVSTVGAYQLSLISAATGAGLSEWAVSRGLSIGPETAEVLDGYIAGGAWFVAAEVSVAAREREVSWLPPLQIAYTSPVISLPIRLGATSSAGMQEMLIFILNHGYEGWTGISNYEEAPIQSECLVSQRDFGAFYEARAHQALEPRGVDVLDDTGDTASPVEVLEATWLVEYGWGSGKCDPCTNDSEIGLSEDTVRQLGWEHTVNDIYVTRVRMRFAPEHIHEDLMLYTSYVPFNSQLRYIQYEDYLEAYFPHCESDRRSLRFHRGLDLGAPGVPLGTAAGFLFFLGLRRWRRG